MLTTTKLVKILCLFAATTVTLQAAQSAPRRPNAAPYGAPSITSPVNNAHVSSPLTIRGTARRNNQVQVHVVAHYSVKLIGRSPKEKSGTIAKQQDLGTFRANEDGHGQWSTAPVTLRLPKGALYAYFEITASQKVGNNTHTSRIVKVFPPRELRRVPLDAIPARGSISSTTLNRFIPAPVITSPRENARGIAPRVTSPLTIRGTAGKNNSVQVNIKATFNGGEQELETLKVKANSSGYWSTPPISLWLPTRAKNASYIVTAQQLVSGKTCLKATITLLPPSNVTYRQVTPKTKNTQGVVAPKITTPKNDAHVVSNFAVSGKGVRGQTIKVSAKLSYTTARADGGGKRTTYRKLGTHQTTVKPDGTWVVSRFRVGDIDWDSVIADSVYVKLSATQVFTNNQEATAPEITVRPTENFENEGTDAVDGTVVVH